MNTITPPLSRRILPTISLFFYGVAAYSVALIPIVIFQIQGFPLIALLALLIGIILFTISFIFFSINTYRVWREINSLKPWLSPEDAKKVPSPGTAIAFLFIPLFNFYWIFIAVGKIPYYFNKAYQGEQKISSVPFKLFSHAHVIANLYIPIIETITIILVTIYDTRLVENLISSNPTSIIRRSLYDINADELSCYFSPIYIGAIIVSIIFWVQSQRLYKRIMAIREQGDPSRDLTS